MRHTIVWDYKIYISERKYQKYYQFYYKLIINWCVIKYSWSVDVTSKNIINKYLNYFLVIIFASKVYVIKFIIFLA